MTAPKKRKRAPGGGRKKGSGAGRTVTLGVRVTPEELREVEAAAMAAGVKTAEYVRAAVRAWHPSRMPKCSLCHDLGFYSEDGADYRCSCGA